MTATPTRPGAHQANTHEGPTTTNPDPAARWWTTTDVAAFLDRSVRGVRCALARGTIPEPDDQRPGKGNRWRPSTIIDWHQREHIASLRWPLQPLLDASGTTTLGMARTLGITRTALHYWATRDLPDHLADDWAVRLGLHPAEVWGPDWTNAALDGAEAGSPTDGEVRP